MINKLKQLFTDYDIEHTDEMLKQFNKYYTSVINKNKVMNLTSLVSIEDFAVKNILDSVIPLKMIKQNAKVVDVGSGAGFPAIPLKILRPDIEIVMVDSLNKRVNFLNEQVELLNLDNAKAVHSRAEDFAKKHRESFDVAIARAVAPLNTLCEYCLPLVKVGGHMIAYKSIKADEEIMQSSKAFEILGGKVDYLQNMLIKEIQSIRVNVSIEKVKATPLLYPRSKNLPKLKPLE